MVYRADPTECNACPVKAACTSSDHGRAVHRSFYTDYLERVRGYHATAAFTRANRLCNQGRNTRPMPAAMNTDTDDTSMASTKESNCSKPATPLATPITAGPK